MTIQQTYQLFRNKQKRNTLIVTAILLLMLITICIDFLFTRFQQSSFYIAESLLFSCYWLLFLPLLHIQWKLAKRSPKLSSGLLITTLAAVVHLSCYPAIVWFLSQSFYYHTFSYGQTFNYGLTAYFIKTAIIYSVSLLMIVLHKNVAVNPAPVAVGTENTTEPLFITSMLVSDSNNTKVLITTSDILYFSANAPYINIYHQSRKYLHTGTLKSLETRLDNNLFIRIHKSCIVNVGKVISYQSRLNGDYDLTLTDNTVLRVSRMYATIFKLRFEQRHRFTVK